MVDLDISLCHSDYIRPELYECAIIGTELSNNLRIIKRPPISTLTFNGHSSSCSYSGINNPPQVFLRYMISRAVLEGFNDLASVYPDIAKEWSDRNLPLLPSNVMAFANKKVWWRCDKGHEWYALISSRSGGHGCNTSY